MQDIPRCCFDDSVLYHHHWMVALHVVFQVYYFGCNLWHRSKAWYIGILEPKFRVDLISFLFTRVNIEGARV